MYYPLMNTTAGTTETTIRRVRCDNCRRLYDPTTLINVKPGERPDYVLANGPCANCGAGGHVIFGMFGPVDIMHYYSVVGVKATKLSNVKCGGRCIEGKSIECKCSCGGENHGMGAA